MESIKVPKEKLIDDLGLPYERGCVRLDEHIDSSRWSETRRVVFDYNGKTYEAFYSQGLTESQDEGPWEYEEEVELFPVHEVEKTIKVWERVKA